MAESEVKCFGGVQTTQNSKTEGGIKRTKHENVKLKKEDVALGDFTSRKKLDRRMHRETASEMTSLPVEPKQPERKCSWISHAFGIKKKCQPRGVLP